MNNFLDLILPQDPVKATLQQLQDPTDPLYSSGQSNPQVPSMIDLARQGIAATDFSTTPTPTAGYQVGQALRTVYDAAGNVVNPARTMGTEILGGIADWSAAGYPLAPSNSRTPGQGDFSPATMGDVADGLGTAWDATRNFTSEVMEGADLPVNETVASLGGAIDPTQWNFAVQANNEALADKQAVETAMAPNEDEDPEEARERSEIISVAGGEPEVNAVIKANPNANIHEVKAASSASLQRKYKESEQAAGNWDEEKASAWDTFNDKYDLSTVGMALLASSGNGKSMATNLGGALSLGAKEKERQSDKKSAAAAKAMENAAAARKAELDELNTLSQITSRDTTTAIDLAKLPGEIKLDWMNAAEKAVNIAGGKGKAVKNPTKDEVEAVAALIEANGVYIDPDNATDQAAMNSVARYRKWYAENNPDLSPAEVDAATRSFLAQNTKTEERTFLSDRTRLAVPDGSVRSGITPDARARLLARRTELRGY